MLPCRSCWIDGPQREGGSGALAGDVDGACGEGGVGHLGPHAAAPVGAAPLVAPDPTGVGAVAGAADECGVGDGGPGSPEQVDVQGAAGVGGPGQRCRGRLRGDPGAGTVLEPEPGAWRRSRPLVTANGDALIAPNVTRWLLATFVDRAPTTVSQPIVRSPSVRRRCWCWWPAAGPTPSFSSA